jgi:uncharacterized membrane protein
VRPHAKISSWGSKEAARRCSRHCARVLPWRGPIGFFVVLLSWLAWLPGFPSWGVTWGAMLPLHRPMDYRWQTWEQCLLTGVVPSCHIVEVGVTLYRLSRGERGCIAHGKGVIFWCWPFRFSADRIYCGEPHPRHVSLSGDKVIMMFMHVLVVESLYQVVIGWIPTHKCPLLGARGR